MAMTKKERAEFDEAIKRVETMAALRWTSPVEADVPIPEFGKRAAGWIVYHDSVEPSWSEAMSHGSMPYRSGCASQGGRHMHSTKLRALKALRHKLELRFAERLAQLDRVIAGDHNGDSND